MLILIMLIFATFYTFFVEQQLAVQDEQEVMMANAIAKKAAFEIKMALAQGDGYTRNFTLPDQVRGENYSVNVTDGITIVRWENRSVLASSVAPVVIGNVTAGENRVQNHGGKIHVD